MEISNKSSFLTSFQNVSGQRLLPPISPFPSVRSYGDCHVLNSRPISKPSEEQSLHQRCSSESFILDEQPSWLEDLLKEPEILVHKGHRRSASDSLACLGTAVNSFCAAVESKQKFVPEGSSWGFQNFVQYEDSWNASFNTKPNPFNKQQTIDGLPSARDGIPHQISPSPCNPHDPDSALSAFEKHDLEESGSQNQSGSGERNDSSQTRHSVSKTDAKRAKQQSAHRSRVRKLQYIAELERNVQSLHAEGSEVSAELEFLDQQNLILGMENRALRQRLETLSQEHLIKHLEQDMLEREIARLQTLYQLQLQQHQQQEQQLQQQHKQQQSKHRRSKSRDLESQFANLSMKHAEASSNSGPVNGSVHI